jgi:hypothetical protein
MIVVEKDHTLGNGDVYTFPDAEDFKIGEHGDFRVIEHGREVYVFKSFNWDNGGFGNGAQNRHSLHK